MRAELLVTNVVTLRGRTRREVLGVQNRAGKVAVGFANCGLEERA